MCQFPYAQSPSISNSQNKKSKSIPLFLLTKKAQKKKLQKRKRRKKISRSAEYLPSLGDADTHAPRMCQFPYKIKSKYSQQTKEKIKVHSAFSFDEEGAKEKATKKENAERRFRALRSAYPVSATPTHTLRVCVNSHRCRWTTPPF